MTDDLANAIPLLCPNLTKLDLRLSGNRCSPVLHLLSGFPHLRKLKLDEVGFHRYQYLLVLPRFFLEELL